MKFGKFILVIIYWTISPIFWIAKTLKWFVYLFRKIIFPWNHFHEIFTHFIFQPTHLSFMGWSISCNYVIFWYSKMDPSERRFGASQYILFSRSYRNALPYYSLQFSSRENTRRHIVATGNSHWPSIRMFCVLERW